MSRTTRLGDDALFEQARKAAEDPSSVKPVEGPTILDDGTIAFEGISADTTRYTVIPKVAAVVPADAKSDSGVIEFDRYDEASKLTIQKNPTFKK